MGENWKGKVGALGGALAALGGFLHDLSVGTLDSEKIALYWAAILGCLSLFGIRDAMGPSEKDSASPASSKR